MALQLAVLWQCCQHAISSTVTVGEFKSPPLKYPANQVLQAAEYKTSFGKG
jgi:hypothetical protein